jgi:hypothetical protein
MRRWRNGLAAAIVLVGVAAATPAQASYWEDAGWGTLTVLTNLIYMPAKLTYATLGGLTGGLALGLTGGDMQTAETVWIVSMGGTYVVTPRMLQGEDAIAFAGSPTTETTAESNPPPPAQSSSRINEQSLGGS